MNNRAGEQSLKQKLRSNKNCLSIGTWNVCTLVKSLGDEHVCRKVNKPGNRHDDPGMVDRKLDLLVRELKRHGISIAGIQETKWFGSDMSPAGHPLPSDQERGTRNEGIEIALNKKATAMKECRRGAESSQFKSGYGAFDVDRVRKEEALEA